MSLKIIIDKLSGHDQEGIIGKIYKRAGDEIVEGDLLFTIESGKGTLKYLSEFTGVINALDIDEGDTVKKNQVVGHVHGDEKCSKASSNPGKKTGYSFGINTPTKEDISCEVLIIGGGPGGYVAAIRAAQLGKKVVLVEKDQLGGTCLNYGCIPTKALVQSVEVINKIKEAHHFGFEVNDFSIDFSRVISRKDEVVRQLVSGIQGLMIKNNIRVIEGEALVADSNVISVKTRKIDAKIRYENMILALGASPIILPIEGADLCQVITSKEALELEEIPKSMTIIGGGIIGMEIAFIYNALGCEVSVVEYLPRILACLDTDVGAVVRQEAIEKGIHIYDGTKAVSIKETMNHNMITEVEVAGESYLISSDKVLMAVGRRANLDALDLEQLGVILNDRKNGIEVNEYMETSVPNIYAIGDITNKIQLAHVASHQGMVAAEHISGIMNKMHYNTVPSVVFTSPEVATVGINETDVEASGLDVKVSKFPLMACGKAVAMNETIGFVKLITDTNERILLGASIVGAHSSDLITVITQLIESKTTLDEALKTIYAHPTLGESIHEALLIADGRGIHFG